jgi:uncharacterized protein YjbJ (UPF0337 family)
MRAVQATASPACRSLDVTLSKESTMDKDRSAGVGHQVKGAVKEAAGKVTGNERLEAEGTVERAGGKVQEGVGKGKDAVRDVTGR